jgi:hypothetical protein
VIEQAYPSQMNITRSIQSQPAKKIGGTTLMLAAPLDPDKAKLFEGVRDVMRTTRSC